MSTPSEKHSVKDILDMVAKGIEDWRELEDYQGEARLWDHLASWAQSCARYARNLDEFKDMLRDK